MKTKEQWMLEAIRLAERKMNDGCGGPFAAIIVKDNKIVARGWNKVTSENDPTAHAEIVAIRKACKKMGSFWLEGCEIYATGEPCPMCLSAILWAKIDHVYYAASIFDAEIIGFNDHVFYCEVCKNRKHHKIPMEQMCREQALDVYNQWKNKQDKIEY